MRLRVLPAIALLLLATACQTSGGASMSAMATATPMRTAAATLPPKGFVDFCKRFPAQCDEVAEVSGPVTLDATRRAELARVNDAVNRGIRYVADSRSSGQSEYWTLPQTEGDCEDLALEKRRRLIALGWPQDALLIALATVPRVGGHAVLVAVTDRGDFVLDVRDPEVRPWEQVPYRWVRRQSPTNPRVWLSLKA